MDVFYMALREDKLGQTWLIPPRIDELIPENHICHLIIALMDKLDFSTVEEKYRCTRGRPAYSRKMLLRLLLLAYTDCVFSSRKIAKLAEENVIYMYVTGNEKPDFRTICNFKIECKFLIAIAFLETVYFARSLGMTKLGKLPIDGTIIKANASNQHSISEKELELVQSLIDKGILVDMEEDDLYGDERGDQLPPGSKSKIREILEDDDGEFKGKLHKAGFNLIKSYVKGDAEEKQKVQQTISKAREELNKSEQKAVSLTDPESRFMKNKKGHTELSYNYQTAVDSDTSIIVASIVSANPTDHKLLKPVIEEVEKNLGPLPQDTIIPADNGYFSGENLRYLEEKGLDGYIPNKKQASKLKSKKSENKPYSKDKFTYDPLKDEFICPESKILTLKGKYFNKKTGKYFHTYYGAKCKECPVKIECTGRKNRVKVITSNEYEPERQRMAFKMETPEAKKVYQKRSIVEQPFGNIKHNMKYIEFLTRGLSKIKVEKDLINSAHNLKRIWNKMLKTTTRITGIFQREPTKTPNQLILT